MNNKDTEDVKKTRKKTKDAMEQFAHVPGRLLSCDDNNTRSTRNNTNVNKTQVWQSQL